MIDAKHVHKLLECKYDFKHWIKDVISSFNFKDGIDYIGKSSDVKRRLSGLSIVEDNLTLIAYVNKDIESELHARFDIKGIYREWFNLSDCDLNDIIDKYKFKLCDMA